MKKKKKKNHCCLLLLLPKPQKLKCHHLKANLHERGVKLLMQIQLYYIAGTSGNTTSGKNGANANGGDSVGNTTGLAVPGED
jgi:hypothetical protein